MGPQPKRKISKGRRNRRRAHDAIGAPQLVTCPNCQARILPHRICPTCGQYKGRQVIDTSGKE
ncbi:MAG: 50S ribosomal protein L32 [Caldilineaceae bacterium]|nr:50S ribosomal protein L32 [Caldilineaceae bacterium]